MEDTLLLAAFGWLVHWVWPIVMFVLGLGVVIFVHELGHFLMARLVGIRVETFALGMGPRVCGYRGKETDYCLRLVPIGGYVKMTGQEDFGPLKEGEPDTRSFSSKTVGQRMLVISAGVVMNVIFAALAFVLIGSIGMKFPATVVGGVLRDYPADQAQIVWDASEGQEPLTTEGLQPGDRIVALAGKPVNRFDHLLYAAILGRKDQTFEITVQREIDGVERIGTATVGLKKSGGPAGIDAQVFRFGIEPALTLVLAGRDDAYVVDNGLKPGDTLVAVDGLDIQHQWDLDALEAEFDGRPVTVTVQSADSDERRTAELVPALMTVNEDYGVCVTAEGQLLRVTDSEAVTDGDGNATEPATLSLTLLDGTEQVVETDTLITEVPLDVLGMSPRLRLATIVKGDPAEDAGLLPGDVIVSYGSQPTPSLQELRKINDEALDNGTDITVLRDGITQSPIDIHPHKQAGRAVMGTMPGIDQDHLVVAHVRPGSPAAAAGIVRGCEIQRVNDRPVATWPELINALTELQGQQIVLAGVNGSLPFEASLPVLDEHDFNPNDYRYQLLPHQGFEPMMVTIHFSNPLSAIAWGAEETLYNLQIAYSHLRALIGGTVPVKEVRGPVGIGDLAVKVARKSGIQFVYLMAFISVAVAVCNFLPLPVLDGGHAVFLIIEKIRGKPLSVRIINIVQVTGFVLLIGLILLITGRDLLRIVDGW